MEKQKQNSWRNYFALGEVGSYFFRKPDPNRPKNFSLRMMHGVNKISILLFLAGVLYMILKRVL